MKFSAVYVYFRHGSFSVSCVSEKEEDFSVLPACFTIQLSPMLCRVVISYNMLNVSLILLIFLRSIF